MRSLAAAAVCSAAFFATGAMAQQATPTGTPNISAPQQPVTAAPESPAFGMNNFGPVAVAYNFGVASDYAFRGVSQTDEGPSVFGGIDATYKTLYGGVWASNVDFNKFGDPKTNTEIDVYGGWKPTFAGFSLDVGGIYYAYYNQPTGGPSVDYFEGYFKASKAFGPITVGGSFYYSPEFTGETGDAQYYEGNAAWAIDKQWSITGAFGHQEIEKAASYNTWNVGVSYALSEHIALDLRYWDTDEHGFGDAYGERVIGGLKVLF